MMLAENDTSVGARVVLILDTIMGGTTNILWSSQSPLLLTTVNTNQIVFYPISSYSTPQTETDLLALEGKQLLIAYSSGSISFDEESKQGKDAQYYVLPSSINPNIAPALLSPK